MFRNDLGYMHQNVKIVGRNAGLTYSDLGATHQSLDDVAIAAHNPGRRHHVPGRPRGDQPRGGRGGSPRRSRLYPHRRPLHSHAARKRCALPAREGNHHERRTAMSPSSRQAPPSGGHMTPPQMLRQKGIRARLVSMHTLKPLDRALVIACARETAGIVTVEEHYLAGGLGSAVAEILSCEKSPTRLRMIGVDDQFAGNGPYDELLGLYGLRAEQIADTVEKFTCELKPCSAST